MSDSDLEPRKRSKRLSPRKRTMRRLGYRSLDPVKELERQGKLKVIRPSGKKRGQVFHFDEEVEAIANGEEG